MLKKIGKARSTMSVDTIIETQLASLRVEFNEGVEDKMIQCVINGKGISNANAINLCVHLKDTGGLGILQGIENCHPILKKFYRLCNRDSGELDIPSRMKLAFGKLASELM